ncbi:helix-turn-helix domain-containing protein [uncultured Ferrovibrio sp.]|jgi:CRP/FNR family transcriptional regulator|uniref:helix-turn-helix domain-containing protein n=1 Tax=uncultured Ferrovibrio sp. TaxID=1576913 RepID=UPI002612FEC8|nr:helix-turn-helix domain-containing protein [uncultured Ferrovibrio sp.]
MTQALAYQEKARIAPVASQREPVSTPRKPALHIVGGQSVNAQLQQIASVVHLEREETLLDEGDPADHVYQVARGTLRAVKLLPDGRRCITKFIHAGDHVGLSQVDTYSFSIEAVTDATLVRYPRRRFQALLQSDAKLMHSFYAIMCDELAATQDRMLLLGRKSASERLASFLLNMAMRSVKSEGAMTEDGGIIVELPMSRADIADYLGLTIETVSRLISKLRAQRIITLRKAQEIVLLRRDLLEEMSEAAA